MFINDIFEIKKLGLGGGTPTPPTSIGYTVTFNVDGNAYYIAECLAGDTISEPPAPTKVGEAFTGWYDGESNLISFPYTPSADITLSGQFASARVEMQIDTNGNICTYNGNSVVNSGSDFVIAGVDSGNNHRYIYIMSKSALSITGTTLASTGTYDYDGETWYYGCIWGSSSDTSDINSKVYDIPNAPAQIVQNVKAVLDHYYYAD